MSSSEQPTADALIADLIKTLRATLDAEEKRLGEMRAAVVAQRNLCRRLHNALGTLDPQATSGRYVDPRSPSFRKKASD